MHSEHSSLLLQTSEPRLSLVKFAQATAPKYQASSVPMYVTYHIQTPDGGEDAHSAIAVITTQVAFIADVEVYQHWWSGTREPGSMMEPRVVRGRWSTLP
jgi:hypothetical protein